MSRIIRIYGQSNNWLPLDNIIEDLEGNGITIKYFVGSTYGGCWFFEVEGNYIGKLDVEETNINTLEFNWDV